MRADDQDRPGFGGKVGHVKLAFLGPEFLTWLYFHIDQLGGEIPFAELIQDKTSKHQMLRISVGKRIALKPLAADDIRVTVTGPALDDSGEVLQAIRAGAYVDSMSLDMVIAERIHSFTINASDGAISNAKTRQLFEIKDEEVDHEMKWGEKPAEQSKNWSDEESILLRMSSLDEIEEILSALFSRFLSRRLAQAFVSQEISTIRQTVADGLKAKLPPASTNYNEQTLQTEEEVLA